jgi:hypothetical protein
LSRSENKTPTDNNAACSTQEAAHGKGNRGEYYNKWDKFATEEIDAVEAEEKAEAEASAAALGLNAPKSEAEAKDMAKRAALKQTKKEWEEREATVSAAKLTLTETFDAQEIVEINSERMGDKKVLEIAHSHNASFHITASGLIKLFIQDCHDCVFNLDCKIITSFVEMSGCHNVEFNIHQTLATFQLDLCENVRVHCVAGTVHPATGRIGWSEYVVAKPRIIHAGEQCSTAMNSV